MPDTLDLTFATPADQQAWSLDLAVFGRAMLDEHGKHIPMDTVLAKGTQITVKAKRVD